MQGWAIIPTIALFLSHIFFYYPCEHPVTYHLGSIDPRFNLSQSTAEMNMHQATAIWGQQYFLEDPQAKLSVNFVYDQRSGLASQINTQEDQISADKATLETQIATFETKVRSYEQQVSALNTEIQDWNRKGGAPEDIYQQLTARQQQLQSQQQALLTEQNQLNQAAKKFNLQVTQLNGTISSFNTLLGQKPEEGLYDGANQQISVYFVNTHPELVHTLAHEFGHALGLDHNTNPQSIMYAYTSESMKTSSEDQTALVQACTPVSKLQILLQLLRSKFLSFS